MFPFSCFMKPWAKGGVFLQKCRSGVLQYVAYSSSMSIVNLLLDLTDNFHEGDLSLKYGYVYIVLIRSFSQGWALYCLVLFYHTTADLLAPIRPFPKFLSIKLIVFATFWQAIAIGILEELHLLPLNDWQYAVGSCVPDGVQSVAGTEDSPWATGWNGYNTTLTGAIDWRPGWNTTERGCTENLWWWRHPTDRTCIGGQSDSACRCINQICYIDVSETMFQSDVSKGLQSLLICCEMFVASLCHLVIFSYKVHLRYRRWSYFHAPVYISSVVFHK